MNRTITAEMQWKKIERKLANLAGFGAKNAMRAAAPAAFRLIDTQNAKSVENTSWKTDLNGRKQAFRKRASKKGGYKYKVERAGQGIRARSMYNYKHPEMRHGHLVENGVRNTPPRKQRTTAFFRRKKAAQAKFMEALLVAIKLAGKHPKGRVSAKDVTNVVGTGWGDKA